MIKLQNSNAITSTSLNSNFRNCSFWMENLSENEEVKPLRGKDRCDIAIIGGGFTGLSTAYNTRKLIPGTDVRVLEANICGFGSSGRNGGFSSTLIGMSKNLTTLRFGKKKAIAAHHYMEDAVDYVDQIIHEHAIDCSYERNGSLLVATNQAQAKRVEKELSIAYSWGLKGVESWNETRLSHEFNNRNYRLGLFRKNSAILNPAGLTLGLKRIAEKAGAFVHEMSPVTSIEEESNGFRIRTPEGELQADRLVYATNAYSTLFPRLSSKQTPLSQAIILSKPLSDSQLNSIGWNSRCGIEDARNRLHYYRLTSDNRILMGGGDISPVYGRGLNYNFNKKVFAHLEQHANDLFPQPGGLKITHRWSGVVSVALDLAPVIGYLGRKKRALFSLGLMGHGVSMAPYNGLCMAELLAGKKNRRTEMFFVGRQAIPWPPSVIRFPILHGVRGLLKIEDMLRWD